VSNGVDWIRDFGRFTLKVKILSFNTGNTVFPVFTFRSPSNNFVLIEYYSEEGVVLRLLSWGKFKLRKEKRYETEGIVLNSSVGVGVSVH